MTKSSHNLAAFSACTCAKRQSGRLHLPLRKNQQAGAVSGDTEWLRLHCLTEQRMPRTTEGHRATLVQSWRKIHVVPRLQRPEHSQQAIECGNSESIKPVEVKKGQRFNFTSCLVLCQCHAPSSIRSSRVAQSTNPSPLKSLDGRLVFCRSLASSVISC